MRNNKFNKILETEDYVPFSEEDKRSLSYKIAHGIKEKIREHKWNRGTEGISLSWDDAVQEWMNEYYEEYVQFIKDDMWPKRYRKSSKLGKISTTGAAFSQKPFHVSI